MKEYTLDNTLIKVGGNKKENWELLDNAKPEFWWLHLSHFPSAYVIIENENPSENMLKEGGIICKSKSKYKNMKNLRIDYTQCSNLEKGGKEGEVIYISLRKVKNIKV